MQLERKWLEVAEIFQLIVDMAYDDRAILRRGPSISKAIDLCELENGLRSHSQLRQSWSEFRDVAHLLTAAAVLDPYLLFPAKNAGDACILVTILVAPDVMLSGGLRPAGVWTKSKVDLQRAADFATGQAVANTVQSRTGRSVCHFP